MRLMNFLITRPMLASASQVVFISEITIRAFADVKFRKPPRLIFNGVNTDVFRPVGDHSEKIAARRHFGLPLNATVALFVGRFVEKKGLNILRQAAEMEPDTIWAFAGWGPLDPARWELPNVRVFAGLSGATLAPLYRASDAFVLPSMGEGFPLVLQEALASGVPTICSAETVCADHRAAPLLHGVKIDARDLKTTAAQLVEAVVTAINDNTPEQAAQRSRRSSEWYSWARAVKLYLALIDEVARVPAIPDSLATNSWPATGAPR